MRGEGVLQFIKPIGDGIDIKDKVIHQMRECIDKFGKVAGSLAAERRCCAVQTVKTLLEWLEDRRFVGGNTDTGDLSCGDEILLQRTDVVINVMTLSHVFVLAIGFIKVADIHAIGIIGIDDKPIGQIGCRAPDIGKTEDGNTFVNAVFGAEIDIPLHRSIVISKCAVGMADNPDHRVFVKICLLRHLITPLTVPRDLRSYDGDTFDTEVGKRFDIRLEYGKMRV